MNDQFSVEEKSVIAHMEGAGSGAPLSGDFVNTLIDAIARADTNNLARLRMGFPELVTAVLEYKYGELHNRWFAAHPRA
jgi:hypothetical protein